MTQPTIPLLALVLLAGVAPAQPAATDPGVTVRVYQIAETPDHVPTVGEGQTPNADARRDAIDLGPDDFGGVQGSTVTTVLGQIVVDTPGAYTFRLTSDDGARLLIDQRLVIDHDGRHGATPKDSKPVELGAGTHDLRIEHFDAGGSRSLRLEWLVPGADAFAVVRAPSVRTERDLTRVTSPSDKRLEGGRRPGDRGPLAGVHPGWTLSDIRPAGFEPKVGAMCFLPDGRLVVGTFDPLQRDDRSLPDIDSKVPDALYALGNLGSDDPDAVTVTKIASDLYEPMGLCVVDGVLYCSNRKSVIRLLDNDHDGFFETHEVVGTGWEAWNYHQFAMGVVPRNGLLYTALSTAMAPPDWEGMLHNAGPNGPMRGCLIEMDPATGDTRVVAGGLRTPNGIGVLPDGTMIYLDNQGTWMSTSQLAELIPGRFYGHYNWTNLVPKLADRFPRGGLASSYSDRERTPAAVYFPQNEVSNSPTQPQVISSGMYAGQLLVGELTGGGVRRVFLERVNGQLQGALFRFTQGLESGVNRMVWGPDGALYVGGIGAGGNWNWRGTQFGLQRLRPNGRTAFEMFAVHADPVGFRVEFTEPVDKAWLGDPKNYAVESWTYEPTADYGGPKVDERPHTVTRATPGADGRSVTLAIDGLETGRCYHLVTDPVSTTGEAMWSTEAWYTLNAVPHAEAPRASTIAGKPVDAAAVGVGVMPPPEAVTLTGRNSTPSMRYEGKPFPPEPLAQDDFIAGGHDVAVGVGSGDLVTTTQFGDARLHVEWLSPPGGAGQLAGNSGVYLQDRYEIQVLGTPAGDRPPATNEAGAIYERKAADANASTGPGTWQAYDIWFRAPRFKDGRKVEDARITLYWNGVLVHDDVAIAGPTGNKRDGGEQAAEGQDLQLGILRLQDHASGAEGPVRYRNVWIAPFAHAGYTPGPWTRLFDPARPGDWMPRGGRATFDMGQDDLVGTSTPNSPNSFYTSVRTYDDFELIYEANTDPRLNSGVQVRSAVIGGDDNRSGGLRGYQIELDPTDRAYSAGIYDEQRRGWLCPLHAAPYARGAFRPNGWNEVRVVAQGPVIRTWINGVPAAEVFDALTPSGHLGFQVHDVGTLAEPVGVRFRNARIRELSATD